MKYSILMPYIRRAGQLHNTLISFEQHYVSQKNDFEVIIVEDEKNFLDQREHNSLVRILDYFRGWMNIKHLHISNRNQYNPAPLFNIAAQEASGEYFIITNPECFHQTNILKGLDEEFNKNPDVYVMCACESRKGCNHFIAAFDELKGEHHAWYQHSIHRNAQYHFCSALSKDNWNRIGGFDERFGDGIGYDDDDFRDTVKHAGITVVTRDDLLTIHIQHEKSDRPPGHRRLLRKNEELYKQNCEDRASC